MSTLHNFYTNMENARNHNTAYRTFNTSKTSITMETKTNKQASKQALSHLEACAGAKKKKKKCASIFLGGASNEKAAMDSSMCVGDSWPTYYHCHVTCCQRNRANLCVKFFFWNPCNHEEHRHPFIFLNFCTNCTCCKFPSTPASCHVIRDFRTEFDAVITSHNDTALSEKFRNCCCTEVHNIQRLLLI